MNTDGTGMIIQSPTGSQTFIPSAIPLAINDAVRLGVDSTGHVIVSPATQIVGDIGGGYQDIPALWTLSVDQSHYVGSTLGDLISNGTGWTLSFALDINDWGAITGYGEFNGEPHGFLLVPTAFQVREGKINDGFDPPLSDDPPGELPWASVVKGKQSDVVKFVTTDYVASQTELVVSDGPQNVEISPTTGLTAEQTNITMVGQLVAPSAVVMNEATIDARRNTSGDLFARLKVAVLPERTVSLGIYRVSDSTSPAETFPVGGPSNEQIVQTLNSIYKQCGVTFRLDGSETLRDVPFDKNKDGAVQDDEYDAIETAVAKKPGKIKLVLALHGGTPGPLPYDWFRVRGEAFNYSKSIAFVFTSDSGAITDLIAAHEVGHHLRKDLDPDVNLLNGGHDRPPFPAETKETGGALMQPGEVITAGPVAVRNQPGRWLRHEDWIKINERAKDYE